jgi:hypothetical protein
MQKRSGPGASLPRSSGWCPGKTAPAARSGWDRSPGEVIRTGQQVAGPFGSRSRANGKRDKLDNDYGAYRYTVRPVKIEEANEVRQVTA